ncbi:phage tail protein [Dyella silvatica]|uniref:phage tail protein n=1 Tax=Dyella silvatica TaxID=2992128 RepID=UPI00224F7D72|nr:tail fiber protein [Dyella silvatica]
MASFYLGQIMLTGFGFAQRGFALCNGQLMSISQNAALFSLLGTQFGGDGRSTFGLPDMRGVTPIGAGASYVQGQRGGTETVSLTQSTMPQHTHLVMANTQAATVKNPANATYASTPSETLYGASSNNIVPINPAQIFPVGGNLPHDNMQPYLVINFNIALTGIFPSRG